MAWRAPACVGDGCVVAFYYRQLQTKGKYRQDSTIKYIFVVKYFRYPENNITNTHTRPFPLHLYVAAFAPGLPLGTADTGPVTGHCGVLSSVPVPGAPPVMTTIDVPRHVPVSLGGRITPVENHLQITPF